MLGKTLVSTGSGSEYTDTKHTRLASGSSATGLFTALIDICKWSVLRRKEVSGALKTNPRQAPLKIQKLSPYEKSLMG